MKLVKINHIRCDEWTGTTYLLAPEDTTEEQLQKDVDTAEQNYLQSIKNFEDAGQKPKYININNFGELPNNLTVGEFNEMRIKRDQEIKEWDDKRDASTHNFAYYMRQLGYFDLNEDEDALEAEVNWGHRHGETLDISRTKLDVWDLI